jgi:hypothetical protein
MYLKLIKNPILFQGRNKNNNYFEGWYYKQVSENSKNSISIIPGISKSKEDSHAFIQTIISTSESKLETHYHRFSINDFYFNDEPFILKIEKNIFSCDVIDLNLFDNDYSLNGKLSFSSFTKIKTNTLYPNIMGYYAYIPIMECYHGIVSMNHYLNGSLSYNGKSINFDSGKGYIEKDWGTSFPREYIWLQCNNFENKDVSIMCSIANVPFMGASFQGLICNLSLKGKEYRFASYNDSKLKKLNINDHELNIFLKKKNLELELNVKPSDTGVLKSPKIGLMNGSIKEGVCRNC